MSDRARSPGRPRTDPGRQGGSEQGDKDRARSAGCNDDGRSAATQPLPRSGPSYPIDSVDNVLRLLLLVEERGAVRVSEASEALAVAPSTAHRLFAMLEHHGFVEQEESSKIYRLGPTLLRFGLSAVRNLEIRILVRPYLVKLHEAFNETVHLALPDAAEVRFVDCVESRRTLRVSSRVGQSMWAHCTSVGKACLAELSDERVLELYPDEQLSGLTATSVTSRSRLLDQLATVRRKGYAENSAESEDEVGSVGVALCHSNGEPAAGVSIAFPLVRASAILRAEAAQALRDMAEMAAATLP